MSGTAIAPRKDGGAGKAAARQRRTEVLRIVLIVLITFVWFAPILWIALTAFKSRPDVYSMSVAFTTSVPPGATSGPNFASDGGFSTTAAQAASTTGEPIGSSPTITVQAAVPPRISGP